MTNTPASLSSALHAMLINTPVIPVLTLHTVDAAVPVAKAFVEGGISIVEVTLRTPVALAAITAMKAALPELKVGAGTVMTEADCQAAIDAGADFLVSPGATDDLLQAAQKVSVPYLPGVATVSEAMRAREAGFLLQKFFPAESAGGVKALKSIHAVLPDVMFVPTGGIHTSNMDSYLDCANVLAVGGTWIASQSLIENKDWGVIAELADQVMHHRYQPTKA